MASAPASGRLRTVDLLIDIPGSDQRMGTKSSVTLAVWFPFVIVLKSQPTSSSTVDLKMNQQQLRCNEYIAEMGGSFSPIDGRPWEGSLLMSSLLSGARHPIDNYPEESNLTPPCLPGPVVQVAPGEFYTVAEVEENGWGIPARVPARVPALSDQTLTPQNHTNEAFLLRYYRVR
ncbi:hypothetical protein DFH28DRAFT_928512 [Melampsora americana]|nr:hypothetical protein DFH28DRAFT_928512 [Melampsora americana]